METIGSVGASGGLASVGRALAAGAKRFDAAAERLVESAGRGDTAALAGAAIDLRSEVVAAAALGAVAGAERRTLGTLLDALG
jgi:hypothetical protein